jgi:hypothetical protein
VEPTSQDSGSDVQGNEDDIVDADFEVVDDEKEKK